MDRRPWLMFATILPRHSTRGWTDVLLLTAVLELMGRRRTSFGPGVAVFVLGETGTAALVGWRARLRV
jgi:hypothetical protein